MIAALIRRLRGAKPAEDIDAVVRRQLAEQEALRIEALRAGSATLHPLSNVARGSYGYALLQLERDGLMERRLEKGLIPDENCWRYSLTKAGKYAQAMLQD